MEDDPTNFGPLRRHVWNEMRIAGAVNAVGIRLLLEGTIEDSTDSDKLELLMKSHTALMDCVDLLASAMDHLRSDFAEFVAGGADEEERGE